MTTGLVKWLPEGAFDVHLHSSPSLHKRIMNDFEVLEKAKRAGYAGLAIKAHEGSTVERAYLAAEHVGGIRCAGGIVLNDAVGGINPDAVETALRLGGKFVWMPTLSAQCHKLHFSGGKDHSGICILDEKGGLVPEAHEVLRLVREHDAVLATGHLSNAEIHVLIDEALSIGVQKIVVNHADFDFLRLDLSEQADLARKGVFLEKCFLMTLPPWNFIDICTMAEHIRVLGEACCLLVTDLGQPENPDPIDGMGLFCAGLVASGVSEKQCERMLCVNPQALIGS